MWISSQGAGLEWGVGGSVYGKLLKGNSKSRRILARLLSRILGWSDTNSEAFLRTWLWRILAKIGLSWMKDKDQGQDLVRKRVQGILTHFIKERVFVIFLSKLFKPHKKCSQILMPVYLDTIWFKVLSLLCFQSMTGVKVILNSTTKCYSDCFNWQKTARCFTVFSTKN